MLFLDIGILDLICHLDFDILPAVIVAGCHSILGKITYAG